MKKEFSLAACITIIFAVILFCDCSRTTSSVNSLSAKISINNTKIIFKKEFNVDIIIQNNGSNKVNIDVSPDEVVRAPTKTSGGEYLGKGSRCTISVTQDQDKNGQFDFFCTYHLKLQAPKKSITSFSILPGETHTFTFPISPWGPIRSSLPSTAILGPAEIHGELRLLINGQWNNVALDPCHIDFVTE